MSEVATLEAWLYQGNVPLSMLFLGVVLLSYLLEDLAIVTAATLAVEQVMPTPLALLAIFTGIATGDIGLYWLGKLAQKVRFFRYRLLRYQRARRVRRTLHHKAFITLFIVRFIPGLRTVGFTLSGFLDVPKMKFLIAVLSATSLWTALIFWLFLPTRQHAMASTTSNKQFVDSDWIGRDVAAQQTDFKNIVKEHIWCNSPTLK